MATTEQEFKSQVDEHIKKCFEEDPGEHESWQDLYVWMVAMFQSEDIADLSTKEMARMLREGSPAITYELAVEYMLGQYEGCLIPDDPVEEEQMIDDLFQRVLHFMHK